MISASVAACHSGAICSAFGSFMMFGRLPPALSWRRPGRSDQPVTTLTKFAPDAISPQRRTSPSESHLRFQLESFSAAQMWRSDIAPKWRDLLPSTVSHPNRNMQRPGLVTRPTWAHVILLTAIPFLSRPHAARAFIAPPATMSIADQARKFWLVAARQDGCAYRDSRGPASNPCSAYNAPVRG
jgi:hypothetical protein